MTRWPHPCFVYTCFILTVSVLFICFCVKEFVREGDYKYSFYTAFHVSQHPLDTWHESNTCSLTPGCFCRYNLKLHVKAGHCDCRMTFHRGQWRCSRTLKQREEALSHWVAHTPSHKWEVFHVRGLFVSALWLLEKGEVNVGRKRGLQTGTLDDVVLPCSSRKWWLWKSPVHYEWKNTWWFLSIYLSFHLWRQLVYNRAV